MKTKTLLAILFIVFSTPAYSCLKGQEIPGQFIVTRVGEVLSQFKSSKIKFKSIHRHKLNLKSGLSSNYEVATAQAPHADVLKSIPDVVHVEPDCRIKLQSAPNDSLYTQYQKNYLAQIDFENHDTLGIKFKKEVLVAISDTGVDYTHPDLKDNMWVNTKELRGLAGVDDDNNGCIDDIYGCDFSNFDGDPFPDQGANYDHGTHVAGLVGAVRNNSKGITGVAPNVKLMALKAFNTNGATLSSLISSVYYAADMGADILNCSWGATGSFSNAESTAFKYATSRGVINIAAAGNEALPASTFTPASYSDVISVGALNSRDQLSTFSNYGSDVDFVSPGGDGFDGLDEGLLSTVPGAYVEFPGTSMASPITAGIYATILSAFPQLSGREITELLRRTSTSLILTPRRDSSQRALRYNKPQLTAALALAKKLYSIAPTPTPTPEPAPIVKNPPVSGDDMLGQLGSNGDDTNKNEVLALKESGGGGCGIVKSSSISDSSESSASLPWFLLPLLMSFLIRFRRKK